jgi:hypothetical protein
MLGMLHIIPAPVWRTGRLCTNPGINLAANGVSPPNNFQYLLTLNALAGDS